VEQPPNNQPAFQWKAFRVQAPFYATVSLVGEAERETQVVNTRRDLTIKSSFASVASENFVA
jgi:hypothetical protein